MRFSRADTGAIDNRRAWLTTVISRIALNFGAFTVRGGKVVAPDILADPDRLRDLDLTVLD